jgi:3-deoxy-D-manno-octulosonic-acid transferase
MLRRLYSLLMSLASPLFLLHTLNKSRKEPRYRRNLRERFGFAPKMDTCIWIHCVSLGETIAANPLILQLQKHYPGTPLLITNTTATGSHASDRVLRDIDRNCFLPYDLNGAMRRFVRRVQPKIAIIMETELWPNLIHQTHKHQVPIVLNNARLSARSHRGYQRIASIMQKMLNKISLINTQTQADADRFIALGLAKEHCLVSGNIKFDLKVADDLKHQGGQLKQDWGNRPTWVAASTHAGEEETILAAHAQILTQCPDALLILVPRHPNRFDDVYQLCEKSGLRTTRYTQAAPTPEQSVLLGDTVGKLMLFYAATDITFMGGTLAPIGGHNFIEPAVLANALLSGPELHNFSQISQELLEHKALTIVKQPEEIAQAVLGLMKDKEKREQQGNWAKDMAMKNTGACDRQLAGILELINGG